MIESNFLEKKNSSKSIGRLKKVNSDFVII